MRVLKLTAAIVALAAIGSLYACSDAPSKSPDVSASVRRSLDQAGLHDVKVSQDRERASSPSLATLSPMLRNPKRK
jgi:hypothetical protein